MYSRINLADHSAIGVPGLLPAHLVGLSDAQLADLDGFSDPAPDGFAGQGFWPVAFVTPAYDATLQVPDGTATVGAPDPATRTVPAVANLRALTAAELAATLSSAQAAKLAEVTAACGAAILAGYTSAALGILHTYPAKDTDQANMTASVVASLLPGLPADWTTPFWCADASLTWAFVPHTAAQIQQAGQDGKTAILAAQARLADLKAQIAAATTADQVNALSW